MYQSDAGLTKSHSAYGYIHHTINEFCVCAVPLQRRNTDFRTVLAHWDRTDDSQQSSSPTESAWNNGKVLDWWPQNTEHNTLLGKNPLTLRKAWPTCSHYESPLVSSTSDNHYSPQCDIGGCTLSASQAAACEGRSQRRTVALHPCSRGGSQSSWQACWPPPSAERRMWWWFGATQLATSTHSAYYRWQSDRWSHFACFSLGYSHHTGHPLQEESWNCNSHLNSLL